MLKKRLLSLALAALMIFSAAAALADENRVFDYSGLLAPEEAENLENRLSGLKNVYSMDFAILTTDDTEGKGTGVYCADFFNEMGLGSGEGRDGLVLCIDMDNREIKLVTHGGLVQIIDDSRMESVYDAMYDDVSGGYYYEAFLRGLEQIEEYVQEGPRHGQFTYDTATGAISNYYYAEDDAYFQAGLASGEIYYDENTGTYYYNMNYTPSLGDRLRKAFTIGGVAFALITGAISGLIVTLIVRGKYKKEFEEAAYDFHANSSFELTRKDDKLANKFVTTRMIPRNEDHGDRGGGGGSASGFGSGTFSSSSGGSFGGGSGGGGGGRSF